MYSGCKTKLLVMDIFLGCFARFILFLVYTSQMKIGKATAQSFFPALFTFGDSLVDNGNNNFIASLARANYPPNGIDYEAVMPSGRFCNGRTVADYISYLMGISSAPPYLDFNQNNFFYGVNFASGAAGILDESGANYLQRIPMSVQVEYFKDVKRNLCSALGAAQTDDLIQKSLYFVVMGSNDYLNNYLLPNSPDALKYNPQDYQDMLIETFRMQLKTLYATGARKIVVASVGPLGCIPYLMIQFHSVHGECIEEPINKLVRGFNGALKELLVNLTMELPGANFLYANAFDKTFSYANKPADFGFVHGNLSCCGVGVYGAESPCLPATPYCKDRAAYVFWDRYHPTDRANLLLANSFVYGSNEDISPMNIAKLATI